MFLDMFILNSTERTNPPKARHRHKKESSEFGIFIEKEIRLHA